MCLNSFPSTDEISGQGVIPEILENPETLNGDPEILTSQDPLAHMENPVLSESCVQFELDLNSGDVQNPGPNEADGGAEIQQSQSVGQSEEKLEDEEISGVIFQGEFTSKIPTYTCTLLLVCNWNKYR